MRGLIMGWLMHYTSKAGLTGLQLGWWTNGGFDSTGEERLEDAERFLKERSSTWSKEARRPGSMRVWIQRENVTFRHSTHSCTRIAGGTSPSCILAFNLRSFNMFNVESLIPEHVIPSIQALRTWKLWRLSSNLWWILARTTLGRDIWSEGTVAWPKTLGQERLWPEGSEGEQGTDPQARKPPENQGWGKMAVNDRKWERH